MGLIDDYRLPSILSLRLWPHALPGAGARPTLELSVDERTTSGDAMQHFRRQPELTDATDARASSITRRRWSPANVRQFRGKNSF